MSVGLQSLEGLTGHGGSTCQAIHPCGSQVGVDCWQEASVTCHRNLSIALLECPDNMAAGLSQNK